MALNGSLWVLFAFSSILFGGNLFQTHHGYPPAAITDLDSAQRVLGAFGLPGGVLQFAIGVTAFRSRERWAWFALISIPIACAINSYLDFRTGVAIVPALFIFFIYGGLVLIALLVAVRRFLPRG